MNGIVAGRIVHYVLTNDEAQVINQRRAKMQLDSPDQDKNLPVGNTVLAGDHMPMIITAVFPNYDGPGKTAVNGQVFLDGNDSLWVTSRLFSERDAVGSWHWMEKS
jgi:hypothetical protein